MVFKMFACPLIAISVLSRKIKVWDLQAALDPRAPASTLCLRTLVVRDLSEREVVPGAGGWPPAQKPPGVALGSCVFGGRRRSVRLVRPTAETDVSVTVSLP